MTSSADAPPPALLAEIAEVVGMNAALALIEVKGGQVVMFPIKLRANHWLISVLGKADAEKLCHHFTGGYRRQLVELPRGATSIYLTERRKRADAMIAAIQRGAYANEIAAAGGITNRRARAFRAKYLASLRQKAPRS